jgi:dienelactone hydrolase
MKYIIFLLLGILSFPLYVAKSYAVDPPKQPLAGPGGQDYLHASVMKSEFGEGGQRYWIFEPADPAPVSAPVIVFMHGWSAVNPKAYGAWIAHLVKRGNIVIYPLYQDQVHTPPSDYLPNTITALKNALVILQQEGHVHPLLDKCAVVGHSMGGLIAVDLAASAEGQGLPPLKAVMSVEPGKTWGRMTGEGYHLQELSLIPSDSLLLLISGDADRIVKDVDAKKIYRESTGVPLINKNYIILRSDNHGRPELNANHFAPVANDEGFDSGESLMRVRVRGFFKRRMQERRATKEHFFPFAYYSFWKLFDGLCDAAFYGKNREYALGNTPQQKYMGQWSDGVPVKELTVVQ